MKRTRNSGRVEDTVDMRPTGRASKERISGSLSYYENIRSYETASRDGIRESLWFRDASVARFCCIFKGWFKSLPSYHLLPLKDSNINLCLVLFPILALSRLLCCDFVISWIISDINVWLNCDETYLRDSLKYNFLVRYIYIR